jgi:hypothetical protein
VLFEKIVYEASPEGTQTDVLFAASSDNGKSWGSSVTLGTDAWRNHPGTFLIAIGSNVFAIWTDADYSFGQLYFRRSTDNGANWEPVSPNLNNKDRVPRSLQVAETGSSIYLAWANIWPYEVYFLRSTNSGLGWDSVKNISSNAKQSFGPSFGY